MQHACEASQGSLYPGTGWQMADFGGDTKRFFLLAFPGQVRQCSPAHEHHPRIVAQEVRGEFSHLATKQPADRQVAIFASTCFAPFSVGFYRSEHVRPALVTSCDLTPSHITVLNVQEHWCQTL